jgi:hypothetical protein
MNRILITITTLAITPLLLFAQKPINKLTFEEVIQMAKDQSPRAIQAKHTFRASYWEYRSYRAELLPNLILKGSLPDYRRNLKTLRTPRENT